MRASSPVPNKRSTSGLFSLSPGMMTLPDSPAFEHRRFIVECANQPAASLRARVGDPRQFFWKIGAKMSCVKVILAWRPAWPQIASSAAVLDAPASRMENRIKRLRDGERKTEFLCVGSGIQESGMGVWTSSRRLKCSLHVPKKTNERRACTPLSNIRPPCGGCNKILWVSERGYQQL